MFADHLQNFSCDNDLAKGALFLYTIDRIDSLTKRGHTFPGSQFSKLIGFQSVPGHHN